MGKTFGFLEFKRITEQKRPVRERLRDHREISKLPEETDLRDQAARCMDCGIPFCHSDYGCPVNNLVPEWNDMVYRGQWREAYERLELTNNFPEFTGRLCPAPCETACTLAINDSPVTIRQIELAIIENAFKQGWVEAKPPKRESGKNVAVVGSGPAGLAAAQVLRRAGHSVTVYEKNLKIGGLLRYGIPDFKMEKHIIDRRLNQLKAEGIRFRTDVEVGVDISARFMEKNYDVILLTIGAGKPRDLDVPGRELSGIHFAMEYLSHANRLVDGVEKMIPEFFAEGKRVLVIGGGDTGADCVGTANRQGAEQVYQFEILPKPRYWKKGWNPQWPHWPNILRTSTSHEEGCHREWAVETTGFGGKGGSVQSAEFQRVDMHLEGTINKPVFKVLPNSSFSLQIDMVLLSAGFLHVAPQRLLSDLDIVYGPRGDIAINGEYRTNVKKIFAAGDAVSGASLVVRAIKQGREAAVSIDAHLNSIS